MDKQQLSHAIDELIIFIDNNRKYYNRKVDVHRSLTKKMRRGTFDPELAPLAFSRLTDDAARDWNRQFGAEYGKIPVLARRLVDKEFMEEFVSAYRLKEYDFMM